MTSAERLRRLAHLVLISIFAFGMHGCGQIGNEQVMSHRPIDEAEYREIVSMEVPDFGPIEHDKLIRRNEISYYTLTPRTGPDLNAEIYEKGPASICGDCSWAYNWHFWWKWGTQEADGLCRVRWINAMVDFDYHLPLWIYESEASPTLRARYSGWMRDVWKAVNTRTSVVLQEAASLELRLMALPATGCDELDRRIKVEGSVAIGKANSRIDALASSADPTRRDWMLAY